MLYTRHCALSECKLKFQTDNARKRHCTKAHTDLDRVRRWRKNRRKGGGGGGGGNGGGGAPTLFDTISPVDSRAIYAPDTCYRTPQQEPDRKPPATVTEKQKSLGTAA